MATFPLTAAQVGLLPGLTGMAAWSAGVVGYDHATLTVSDALGALITPIIAVSGWDAAAAAAQAKTALAAYAKAKAAAIVATAKAYGAGAPILKADRTSGTVSDLLAIVADAATAPGDLIGWVGNDNSVTAMTAGQIAALAPTVVADRKAIYATLGTAIEGIEGGTITTEAAIDALAWPA